MFMRIFKYFHNLPTYFKWWNSIIHWPLHMSKEYFQESLMIFYILFVYIYIIYILFFICILILMILL
jgi:hypothetical protein